MNRHIFILIISLMVGSIAHAERVVGTDSNETASNPSNSAYPSKAENLASLGKCVAEQLLKNNTEPADKCSSNNSVVESVKHLSKNDQQKLAVLQIKLGVEYCQDFRRICPETYGMSDKDCLSTFFRCLNSHAH